MTPLPADICRCLGARVKPDGRPEVCPMVSSCRRAMEYVTDYERVSKAVWLCQSPDFEMRIRPEV